MEEGGVRGLQQQTLESFSTYNFTVTIPQEKQRVLWSLFLPFSFLLWQDSVHLLWITT